MTAYQALKNTLPEKQATYLKNYLESYVQFPPDGWGALSMAADKTGVSVTMFRKGLDKLVTMGYVKKVRGIKGKRARYAPSDLGIDSYNKMVAK